MPAGKISSTASHCLGTGLRNLERSSRRPARPPVAAVRPMPVMPTPTTMTGNITSDVTGCPVAPCSLGSPMTAKATAERR
jgi:hypothetical protein